MKRPIVKICGITSERDAAICAGYGADILGFSITTELEGLSIRIDFPYGSYKKNASDWNNPSAHESLDAGGGLIERRLDNDRYFVRVSAGDSLHIQRAGQHSFTFPCSARTRSSSARAEF